MNTDIQKYLSTIIVLFIGEDMNQISRYLNYLMKVSDSIEASDLLEKHRI